MMFKIIFTATALAGAVGLVPGLTAPANAAKGEIVSSDEILRDFFSGADAVEKRNIALTPELSDRLRARLGYVPRPPESGSFPVWVGKKNGVVLGYAVIDDEKGMHEPITFAVLVDPDGAVQRQEVLVYREPEGDGITRKAFRRQFVGKTVKSPVRTGVDITIVSGATISSHSMALGVRRALALVTDGVLSVQESPAGRLSTAGY